MSLANRITQEQAFSTPTPIPQATDDIERMARLRLARSENVGPRTFMHLVRRFGSASRALEALPMLAARGGRTEYIPCPEDVAEAEFAAGERAGAELVILGDTGYPPLLAAIDNPPPVLWAKGMVELATAETVAVVGARNASALGLRTARRLTHDLGAQQHVIVSGLARGIDAAAHESALESGTIAVLAGGLDQIYPPEHLELADAIAEQGLLLSECAMTVEPTSRHFPRRNRLISGLSKGVLLIEAASRSGSLITARYALEQGREVMACPGTPEDPRSGGCNALIRDGAALIRSADDVIETLAAPRSLGLREEGAEYIFDGPATVDRIDEIEADYAAIPEFDDPNDAAERALGEQILRLLGPNPVDQDEIARACGATPGELALALLELDLAGRIEIGRDGTVALKAT